MLVSKHMTMAEKSLYRNYLSHLELQKQYQAAKLMVDILSCRCPGNYDGIPEYLKETIQQLIICARSKGPDYLFGNASDCSKKYVLKLYNYALFHLDANVAIQREIILFLMDAIQDCVGIGSYHTFTQNLSVLSEHIPTEVVDNNPSYSFDDNPTEDVFDDSFYPNDSDDCTDLIWKEDEENNEDTFEEDVLYE